MSAVMPLTVDPVTPAAGAHAAPPGREVVLRPGRRSWLGELRELWDYRDLVLLLGLRDVQVRYKQTALGAAWAILQPLMTMVVLNLFFGRLLGLAQHVHGIPYPIFVIAGLLPWTLFSTAVTAASNSLVTHAGIIQKAYFPRLAVPIAAVGAPLVDCAVGLLVLAGMMAWFGVAVSWKLMLLPLLLASTLTAVLGIGILLASITVWYRDFRHVIGFMLQVGFFLTPVIYPVKIVREEFQALLSLNPIGGVIEAFRAVILDTPIPWMHWSISATTGCLALVVGLMHFVRMERRFADVV